MGIWVGQATEGSSDRDAAKNRHWSRPSPIVSETETLRALANALKSLSDRVAHASAMRPDPGPAVMALFIRDVIALRRKRDLLFVDRFFADAAWDILLDLTAARLERKYISVSSLCVAAAVPVSSALRCIKNMADRDILVRIRDPDDARRSYMSLNDETYQAMLAYLADARATMFESTA